MAPVAKPWEKSSPVPLVELYFAGATAACAVFDLNGSFAIARVALRVGILLHWIES